MESRNCSSQNIRLKIKTLTREHIGRIIKVCGWIRTVRDQKSYTFLEVNDGSSLHNLQVVIPSTMRTSEMTNGASVSIVGELVESPGANQVFEIRASLIQVFGTCDPERYPLQKKTPFF